MNKKTRSLSEEVRHKIAAKHDNLKATSPSPETLMFLFPPYIMLLIGYKTHPTVANLPGHGCKRKC
jgi:hypothetical protein